MEVKIVTVMPPPPLRSAFMGGGGGGGGRMGAREIIYVMNYLSNQLKPLFLGHSNRQSFATEMLFIFFTQMYILSVHS